MYGDDCNWLSHWDEDGGAPVRPSELNKIKKKLGIPLDCVEGFEEIDEIYVGSEIVYPAWAEKHWVRKTRVQSVYLRKGIVEAISKNRKAIKVNGVWLRKLSNVMCLTARNSH